MDCDTCGKRLRKKTFAWILDQGQVQDGGRIERRGKPDVFCCYSCLAERFAEDGQAVRRAKAASEPKRRRARRRTG